MENAVVISPDEHHKLQMVLLDMLLEADRICRKHSINYTMIGGTLLGAVRHSGFIPWDDDVDIGMPRRDYERFKELCNTELNQDKFFFQDNFLDKNYRWGYGKLRRKSSEFVRIGQEHMKMKTGIFLDIFPLDNVPNFYLLRLLHAAYCYILRKILYAQAGTVLGKNMVTRSVYKILSIIPTAFTFRRVKSLGDFWNRRNTKLVRTLTFPTPKGGTFGYLARWYADTIDLEFEGKQIRAVRAYDEYLRFKYGDYMVTPPESKRHWHPVSKFKLPDD